MTMRLSKVIGLAGILTACVMIAVPAGGQTDVNSETSATPIPDRLDKIWPAIDLKCAELKQSIDHGPLGNIHHQAFAVRDLVIGLAAQSTSLPDDRKAQAQGDVKFVSILADRLDRAGDANDKTGALENYQKLIKVLADLRVATTGHTP